MEDLLTPLKTISVTDQRETAHPRDQTKIGPVSNSRPNAKVSTPEEALQILRSKSSLDEISCALRYLDPKAGVNGGFNIHTPSPLAAQLANVLVGTVIPDFWNVLKTERPQSAKKKANTKSRSPAATALLSCLRSVTGLGALIARSRELSGLVRGHKESKEGSLSTQHVSDLLEVLLLVLENDNFVWSIWTDINHVLEEQTKVLLLWKESISILCTGKLLSTVAEAVHIVRQSSKHDLQEYWIGDGLQYAKWLGRNVVFVALKLREDDLLGWKQLSQFFGKSLSLGYTDQIVDEINHGLLRNEKEQIRINGLIRNLPIFEQRNVLSSVLRILSRHELPPRSMIPNEKSWWLKDSKRVSGAAALISAILKDNDGLKDHLVRCLTGASGAGMGESILVRRAAITALATDDERVQCVLEKNMEQFGDKLFIKHKPVLFQEVNAQTLLLAAGYVHRSSPMFLFTLGRSSTHLSSISNRLAASSLRSRFLGMVVGMAISELIDKPDSKMRFGLEEVDTPEAKWYLSLTQVQDRMGCVSDLDGPQGDNEPVQGGEKGLSSADHATDSAKKNQSSKVISIEEVEDEQDEDTDDEGLIPYDKPDSDPEDSDEDATMIQRNKPTAPVYIRDLLNYLRATDSYDKFHLGLITGPSLIRRKSNFGTEVSDHATELATVFTGLQDPFSIDDFQNLRLQAMIAILLSQPLQMAQWFARTVFEGDYSIGQRATILTTLGLGARELAGFENEDSSSTRGTFPTKLLPEKLHKLYAKDANSPIATIASKLEHDILEPLALQAADQLSGPAALKVRTFSSRLSIEKTRPKPTANDLAKVVAEGFFFPLTGRLWMSLQSSSLSIFAHHLLLPHLLRTLSLLLHASGPNTPLLPQLTSEFWNLVLSLRSHAGGDPAVREALLFALLTLLEVNTSNKHHDRSRQLAEEHARELVETLGWAEAILADQPGGKGGDFGILEGSGTGNGQGANERGKAGNGDADTGIDEGERTKMLAAGVVVRCREVGEKWRGLMMGAGWE
ncbi:MAG: telomere binding protein [Sclerophora amabilis]|nr:MAG: telomere binding protein [Sclerophora amabilis]